MARLVLKAAEAPSPEALLEDGAVPLVTSDDEVLLPRANRMQDILDVLRIRKRLIMGTAALAVAGGCAMLLPDRSQRRSVSEAKAGGEVELFGAAALASAMASGLQSSAKLAGEAQAASATASNLMNEITSPAEALKINSSSLNASAYEVNLTKMNNLTKAQKLKPETEDRKDGNVCADDEELHANLCYKTCASLTGGVYPIRTTAWSCCMEEPCSFFNSKFTSPLKYCSGYDVSGTAEGKECPHGPGTCMANEEFYLGMCYEKCAILTNNMFPFRSGAATCCRYGNHLACLDALNTVTSPNFDIGGGFGDNHSSTPNSSHAPMLTLTESGASLVTSA